MPRRVLQGTVVSDKMNKTITVLVERRVMHKKYKKYVRSSSKYTAHDEGNQFKIGDSVSIEECRPISKNKSWRVIAGTSAQGEPVSVLPFEPSTRVSAPQAPVAKKAEKKVAKPAAAKVDKAAKAEKKPAAKKETTKAKAK